MTMPQRSPPVATVSLGQCRFLPSQVGNESSSGLHRRRRLPSSPTSTPASTSLSTLSPIFPGMQSVLFVRHENNDSKGDRGKSNIVLCRLTTTPSSSNYSPLQGITETVDCCYNDSIKVLVPSHQKRDDLIQFMTRTKSIQRIGRIRPYTVPPNVDQDRCEDTTFQCMDGSQNHTIQIQPIENQRKNHASPQSESDDAMGSVWFVSELPVPLISISFLRVKVATATAASSNSAKALQQSCHKRQLTGRLVIFEKESHDQNLTTEFSFASSGNDAVFRYEVTSVSPHPGYAKETNHQLLLIMPGTRITIWDSPENSEEGKIINPTIPLKARPAPRRGVISKTAHLILETITCIRKTAGEPNANVSRSFLLTGPPGVGKTFAVRTALEEAEREVANSTLLLSIQGSELLSKGNHPTEASKALEITFQKAVHFCKKQMNNSAIIFLDEFEALVSVDAVAAMLANLLDRVSASEATGWTSLIVVAATNRIDAVPAILRRPGRMDLEIVMTPPNAEERTTMLKSMLVESAGSVIDTSTASREELSGVADACVGYVAADLSALVRKATLLGIQQEVSFIDTNLLRLAMESVGASALRDAALSAPPTTDWGDIAGDAGGAKTALRRAVEWPRTKRKAFASLGLIPPRGILLHGPPGCAKTTLARAAAGASGVAFFSLSPAEVYSSSYVGEAEAVVRRAFTLARSAAPCILFFDEIDAVLGAGGDISDKKNGGGMGGRGSSAEARVLSTFLNEMDGVDGWREDGVLVLGATNRPTTLDAALLRPGRFDKVIYVPPPDEVGRRSILEMQVKNWDCSSNDCIDIDLLASSLRSGHMTGAEIVGACREAAMLVLRDAISNEDDNGSNCVRDLGLANKVKDGKRMHEYLEQALGAVKPLLSDPKIMEEYSKFEQSRAQS